MPDSPPLRSDELVVGCVTENTPKFLGQTLRLLQSIRWFGGSLAVGRVIVGAVERIDPRARRTLESWGAEVRIVPRFEHPNGSANRLQLVPVLLRETTASHFLMLDCDTIVVRDPLPHFRRDVFHAKIAPYPTVTHACFERLFAHFGLPLPARTSRMSHSRTPTIPYFNAGVFSMSREIAERLVPEWRRYNAMLAAEPALAAPCARHLHQAALTLGLVAADVPLAEAGPELNYQLNITRGAPRAYAAIDPAIIHYHDLVGDDGLLLPCPFPQVQQRIERFNDRVREERARAVNIPAASAQPSQQFVVLGAPCSGTSLAAERLAAKGARAGNADELLPSDIYYPHGSLRRRDVDALHRDIADVTKLSGAARAAAMDRARAIAPLTSLLHDPRMPLLFPLWREVLRDPFAVLVWREPLDNARSLSRATGFPLDVSLAVWEEYTRLMLSATIGVPRELMSFGDVTADEGALTPDQRELRDALRSGEALQWDPVPPTRPETRALLAALAHKDAPVTRSRIAALWRRLVVRPWLPQYHRRR